MLNMRVTALSRKGSMSQGRGSSKAMESPPSYLSAAYRFPFLPHSSPSSNLLLTYNTATVNSKPPSTGIHTAIALSLLPKTHSTPFGTAFATINLKWRLQRPSRSSGSPLMARLNTHSPSRSSTSTPKTPARTNTKTSKSRSCTSPISNPSFSTNPTPPFPSAGPIAPSSSANRSNPRLRNPGQRFT